MPLCFTSDPVPQKPSLKTPPPATKTRCGQTFHPTCTSVSPTLSGAVTGARHHHLEYSFRAADDLYCRTPLLWILNWSLLLELKHYLRHLDQIHDLVSLGRLHRQKQTSGILLTLLYLMFKLYATRLSNCATEN